MNNQVQLQINLLEEQIQRQESLIREFRESEQMGHTRTPSSWAPETHANIAKLVDVVNQMRLAMKDLICQDTADSCNESFRETYDYARGT